MAKKIITSVQTDVQARPGRPSVINLGAKTLIVGANGAGKDRVRRSIELALTGAVDDLMGRGTSHKNGSPVRLVHELAVLRAPGAASLTTKATFDSGDVADFTLTEEAGGTITSRAALPAWLADETQDKRGKITRTAKWTVLPVRTVYEKLMSGGDTAVEFFLPYMTPAGAAGDALVAGAWAKPERQAALTAYNAVVANLDQPVEASPVSIGLNTALQDRVAVVRSAATKIIEAVPAGLVPQDVSEDAVALAANRVAMLQRVVASATAQRARPTVPQEVLARRAQQASLVEAAQAFIAGLAPLIEPSVQAVVEPPEIRATRDYLSWLKVGSVVTPTLIGTLIGWQMHAPACPTCATHLPNGQAWSDHLEVADRYRAQTVERLTQALAGFDATLAQAKAGYDTALAAYRDEVNRRKGYQTKLAEYQTALEQTDAVIRAYQQGADDAAPLPDPNAEAPVAIPDGLTIEQVQSALHAAQAEHARLLEARGARKQYEASSGRRLHAQAVLAAADNLDNVIKAVIDEVFDAGVASFTAQVQKYLPAWRLHVLTNLPGSSRRVFRPGIVRDDGGVDYALCGAEQTALVIALTAVVLDNEVGGAPDFALLSPPDDRGWSPDTLAAIMRGLGRIPYQIVLYSTVEPKGRTPAGWSVVNLSPDAAQPQRKPRGADPAHTEPQQGSPEAPAGTTEDGEAPEPSPGDDDGANTYDGDDSTNDPAEPAAAPPALGGTMLERLLGDLIRDTLGGGAPPHTGPETENMAEDNGSAGSLLAEQTQVLLAAGFRPADVARMTPTTRAEAVEKGYKGQDVTVLPDGQLFRF